MSMEFFAWKWLHLFYGDDTDRAKYMHLESALIFIPYGCMVDHFQHIVYDNPDMTKAERHEAWLKLEAEYRPYMQFGDVDFYASGRGWQRQLHIYHYPFYYIDYCLAQTVSLEFWSMSQKDYADAWERYYKFVCEGGKKTFVGLCEAADILRIIGCKPNKHGQSNEINHETDRVRGEEDVDNANNNNAPERH
jgi:oligoendopeptidase F